MDRGAPYSDSWDMDAVAGATTCRPTLTASLAQIKDGLPLGAQIASREPVQHLAPRRDLGEGEEVCELVRRQLAQVRPHQRRALRRTACRELLPGRLGRHREDASSPSVRRTGSRFSRTERSREATVKISARNQLPAKVVAITSGEAIANVELDANGLRLVASITVEAVRDLGLQEGTDVTAVVKASDVMLAIAG
jgi:molybdopterin-binding protein